jgi:hypothetical protein
MKPPGLKLSFRRDVIKGCAAQERQ